MKTDLKMTGGNNGWNLIWKWRWIMGGNANSKNGEIWFENDGEISLKMVANNGNNGENWLKIKANSDNNDE